MTISIMAWYLMIKCLFYCNSFQLPVHSLFYCLPPFYAECGVCVAAVLRATGVGGCLGKNPRWAVVFCTHTLPCHHGRTADSPHLPCLTPLSPALTKPPSSLPPSHVSTPPSGSSKYFPSLLFEASMGHGTSCTNHAGLPWGGRSERTGVSQTHRNPICTVFIQGYFSCQDSHHQSAAGSKQRV